MTEGPGGGGTGPHELPEFQVTPLFHSGITRPSGKRLRRETLRLGEGETLSGGRDGIPAVEESHL